MKSSDIRKTFIEFFESKKHKIVPSAPMVVKNDPTLMFTNAGMNQFKDIFLGNMPVKFSRIANSQKCLRVSGKHNDLEEVGHDTYHHTMFEMLGNWSFGDYFKNDAIDFAWELLVNIFKIPSDRLYATVFEGNEKENLEPDIDAKTIWEKYLPLERIIYGSKKDNFWEMGDIGPCGPCTEVHIDIRNDEDRKKIDGVKLVNQGHPQVIEIWNLVFIQYNRKSNGQLEILPQKHVDTGMGFERLCMVIQGKQSNYDTDVFQPIIGKIGQITGKRYGDGLETDIAMRVVADHLRTIAFSIADGQIPSNNKAGYVIRRILRRAVRYGYTFLNLSQPFMDQLLPVLIETMGEAYPELIAQKKLIEKVITEEEHSFLRTLETGIKLLEQVVNIAKSDKKTKVSGKTAFELYDTFGFPFDLTQLILNEQNLEIDKAEFESSMEVQKNRSRNAANLETGDWIELDKDSLSTFVGYDFNEAEIGITKYRKVNQKNKTFYHLVFNITPFYAESGGQVGDTGYIESESEKISILDTKKENNLFIHITEKLPSNPSDTFRAVVDISKRNLICNNHTATHLLHLGLRHILGNHVEQKGSLVDYQRLRFDFSHFEKVSDEEIWKVETFVNEKIRNNIQLNELREVPMEQAKEMGAMALFGEKYGDTVRVIQFDDSVELCGGTHVRSTGQIGVFKIVAESAIAAGIRRIEAISGQKVLDHYKFEEDSLKQIKNLLKNPGDPFKNIENIITENTSIKKQLEVFVKEKVSKIKDSLISKIKRQNGINLIIEKVEIDSADMVKDLAYQLKGQVENLILVIGAEIGSKVNLTILISENLIEDKNLHAGNIIREIAKEVNGGGGGQAFYATAGGSNPQGIEKALSKALELLKL